MKTITKLFLVGLIALGMTACSNEDEVKFEGKAESTVSVRVVPSSNGPIVRAIGDLDGDGILPAGLEAESAIKTLEVFLFSGESPDGYKSVTDALEVTGIATHIGPKTMIVVANANIGAVASLTVLKAKTKELPVADVLTNGLAMTAEPVTMSLIGGLNTYGYPVGTDAVQTISVAAPLKLHRVNARVAIVAADIGTLPADQSAIFDNLKDVQVAMFNVPKTTNLFGTSLATNADYLFGETWPSALDSYTVGTAHTAFLDATVIFPIVKATAPYYYVNENTSIASKEQMMIVLRGKPYKGAVAVVAEGLYTDAAGYTYYPVWVNATKTGYSYTGDGVTGDSKILRNTQYNITLTINKIGNPGIDAPTEATVNVLVEVALWLVVNQGVIW
mgnify:CR=1 FL=1